MKKKKKRRRNRRWPKKNSRRQKDAHLIFLWLVLDNFMHWCIQHSAFYHRVPKYASLWRPDATSWCALWRIMTRKSRFLNMSFSVTVEKNASGLSPYQFLAAAGVDWIPPLYFVPAFPLECRTGLMWSPWPMWPGSRARKSVAQSLVSTDSVYWTTSRQSQVTGSGKKYESPSKKPRWPPWRVITPRAFSWVPANIVGKVRTIAIWNHNSLNE